MFLGHLGVALATRKVEPRLPLGATVAGTFALDLLWPLFLLLGVETVRVHPGDTAFTSLAFESYPWSHSLIMVVGWSILGGVLGGRVFGSWRAGSVLGLVILSHWVLDFVTHRPDLPLWPGGPVAGLGLWSSVPGTLLVEGAIGLLGLWLFVGAGGARDRTGRWALFGLFALVAVVWVTQPWSPPPPSASAVAWGGLVMWLLPLWAFWIDRHWEAATPGR